jgi:hypothetical protein
MKKDITWLTPSNQIFREDYVLAEKFWPTKFSNKTKLLATSSLEVSEFVFIDLLLAG